MRTLCATLILAASLVISATATARAQTQGDAEALQRAAWAFVFWSQAVTAEADRLGLPAPDVTTRYRPASGPGGALNLLGTAVPGAVTIQLEGEGWQERSATAERILARNAAHEAAHLFQHDLGLPTEERWLHEGFADAIAYELLDARGEAAGWAGGQRCAGALRRAPLRDAFAASDPDALYDCSSVLVRVVAEARGETPTALYRALVRTGRTEDAFFSLAGAAGPEWRRSARAFLSRDWRQADPLWVIRSLRAGQL